MFKKNTLENMKDFLKEAIDFGKMSDRIQFQEDLQRASEISLFRANLSKPSEEVEVTGNQEQGRGSDGRAKP